MTPRPLALLLRTSWLSVLARAALVCAFAISGVGKLLDWSGAVAEAQHFGLEPAEAVVVLTIVVQLGGSLAIVLGRYVWLATGALSVFTALATIIAHDFWNSTDAVEHMHQMNSFFEHVGLIGGFMLAAILAETTRPAS